MSEIFISLLSGVIGGAVITALFNYFSEKKIRRIQYIKSQIDNFYGPLSVLLMCSRSAFEIANEILRAYEEVFSGQWSQDDKTQQRLTDDSKQTIEISNKYIELANKKNAIIFNTISRNYSFIDLDDMQGIEIFLKNYTRLKVEYEDNNQLPHRVYRIVGDISFLRRDFQDQIVNKFNAKKLELLESSLFSICMEKIRKRLGC